MAIIDDIKEIIAEQMGVDAGAIAADKDIIKDLGCDSLDIVTMLMEVEDKYGIEVEENAVSGMTTINDVVSYIEKRI